MLRIRFLRTGKKNRPFFRIVATDSTNPPQGGRPKEKLGFFDPLTREVKLNAERIKYWISVGAQPSDRVHNLLIKEGVIEGKKIAVHSKGTKQVAEVEESKKEPEEIPKGNKEQEVPKEEIDSGKKEAPKEETSNEKKEEAKEEVSNEKEEVPKETKETETKEAQKKNLSQEKPKKKE